MTDEAPAPHGSLPARAVVHVVSPRYRLWTVDRWLAPAAAEELFTHVRREVPLDHHPTVVLYGKELRMRRSVGFFCDTPGVTGYKYSGQESVARPLTEPLRQVLAATNAALGTAFNGLLVNLYADGTETIGAHSDSEVGLGKDGSVAALSLGAERIFRVKCKATKKTLADIRTRHGQLLVMEKVHFQRECTHEIPVQKTIHGPRVSITFRQHALVTESGPR